MLLPHRAIRAAILYVKAGDSAQRRDYVRAREQIEEVFRLIGPKAERRGLFYLHLRAAQISEELGDSNDALDRARTASILIEANTRLGPADRSYLLDYCDLLVGDITGVPVSLLRVGPELTGVKPRYTREYPIVWN